jgi:hypothetical protein
MKVRVGLVVAVVVTVIAGLGVLNVVRGDPAVEALARARACAGRGPRCTAARTRIMRTPFFQEHQFRVNKATVDVRCVRSWILVGRYQCQAPH